MGCIPPFAKRFKTFWKHTHLPLIILNLNQRWKMHNWSEKDHDLSINWNEKRLSAFRYILAYHMQVLGMDLQLFPSSWYLKILEHYVVVMCDLPLCFGGNGNHLFCHNYVWQKGWNKLFPSTPLSCFPSFYNVLILWVYLKGDWVMIYWEKRQYLTTYINKSDDYLRC